MKHEYKIDTGLWYNCYECQDYYEDEPEVSETDAISAAIQHCKTQAPSNCGVMYEQYTAVAEWLQELAAFKDETPITTEFLNKNFSFVDSDDSDGIWAALYDNDPYYAKIQIDTDCHNEGFKVICEKGVYYAETVGQLKMFLTLCGVQDFVKQLKE